VSPLRKNKKKTLKKKGGRQRVLQERGRNPLGRMKGVAGGDWGRDQERISKTNTKVGKEEWGRLR